MNREVPKLLLELNLEAMNAARANSAWTPIAVTIKLSISKLSKKPSGAIIGVKTVNIK